MTQFYSFVNELENYLAGLQDLNTPYREYLHDALNTFMRHHPVTQEMLSNALIKIINDQFYSLVEPLLDLGADPELATQPRTWNDLFDIIHQQEQEEKERSIMRQIIGLGNTHPIRSFESQVYPEIIKRMGPQTYFHTLPRDISQLTSKYL